MEYRKILLKKTTWIPTVIIIFILVSYIGSYCYLRYQARRLETLSIEQITDKLKHLPSCHFISISFGVGIGDGPGNTRGAWGTGGYIDSKEKFIYKKWMMYLYYPLFKLEVKLWQIKTFGW